MGHPGRPSGEELEPGSQTKEWQGGHRLQIFSCVSSAMDKVHEHTQPISHGYAPNSALQWMYVLPRVVRRKNLSVFHVL